MKKILFAFLSVLLILLCLGLVFAFCKHIHEDGNGDEICDTCSASVHKHKQNCLRLENVKAATCTSFGNFDEVIYCSCGAEMSRKTNRIEKKEHEAKPPVRENEVPATCHSSGSYDTVVYCRYGEELSRKTTTVGKISHHLEPAVRENEVAPTCTAKGSFDEVLYCKFGEEFLRTQKTIEKKEHTFAYGSCTACGKTQPSEGLMYTVSGDKTYAILTGIGTCADEHIVIADTYQGLPVRQIGNKAFYTCENILTVEIGGSVESIGARAFQRCTSLISIKVDTNNDAYKSIDGNLYSKDGKTLVQYAIGKTDASFEVPSTVTKIGSRAFLACTSLTSVLMNEKLTTIDTSAFLDCTALVSVVIPDSVTSMGNNVFEGCTALTSVIIGNGVKKIGASAFSNCHRLASVVIGAAVKTIDSYAFYHCESLTALDIPKNVTKIASHAFEQCSALTSIDLGEGVKVLDVSAFYGCASLAHIEVESANATYRSIDGNLYSKDGKTLLQYAVGKEDATFYVPAGVTSIGERAFSYSTSLIRIVLSEDVTTIGYYAFYNCFSLASVFAEGNLDSVQCSAFEGCRNLCDVYYAGTEEEWSQIAIGGYNESLASTTRHYNYIFEA